ncbi:MAG: 3-dehydroquinate synthase [Oscillospiraceae bacterium]|nr:3-dehydroquinate synthase [Oscillospiraceae bacterium]
MKKLTVDLPGRAYDILIERSLLDQAGAHCKTVLPKARKLFIVTDSNVGPLYGQRVLDSLSGAGFQTTLYTIPAGEQSKNPAQLAELWESMMAFGLTRTDAVAALGGGVVGDLTGFAAATVLRGVDFVQIPTTLLAQVDSSVGGKVAVDLSAGKNLAGAFWQPKLVLMDPETLNTLPLPTFMEGMAEVIKYGCILNSVFFRFLEIRPSRRQIMEEIEHVLYVCCNLKRSVVVEDERDTGLRMLLNFGHTLGHAYELAGHYTEWSHGEAVAAGMCVAAQLGVRLGVTPAGVPERIADICASFGLPTAISCTMEDYAAAVGLDKKGAGADISLILLEQIGNAVPRKLPKNDVLDLISTL